MKRLIIALMLMVLFVLATLAKADTVVFDDGEYQTYSYYNMDNFERSIIIDNNSEGDPTTVELVSSTYLLNADVYDSSQIIVNGLSVSVAHNLNLFGDSQATILLGDVGRHINGRYLHSYDSSRVTISHSLGYVGLYAHNNSLVRVTSSTSGWCYVKADGDSNTIISKGGIYGIYTMENSNVFLLGISGGLYDPGEYFNIVILDDSIVTIVGSNFTIDGQEIPYGSYSYGDLPIFTTLNGTLLKGGSFSSLLTLQEGCGTLVLTPIPEPTTISLLALGSLLAITRRKKSSLMVVNYSDKGDQVCSRRFLG